MPGNAGLAPTEIAGSPVDEVGMEVGGANLIQEERVLDSVECFADIDGHRSCA